MNFQIKQYEISDAKVICDLNAIELGYIHANDYDVIYAPHKKKQFT